MTPSLLSGWQSHPGKYDGRAITVHSTGERLALVEVAPLTFEWRVESPVQPPSHDPAGTSPRS